MNWTLLFVNQAKSKISQLTVVIHRTEDQTNGKHQERAKLNETRGEYDFNKKKKTEDKISTRQSRIPKFAILIWR